MTKITNTPKALLLSAFNGYYSRSIQGMRRTLLGYGYEIEESEEIIWFWIEKGMVHGTWTNDDHFTLNAKIKNKTTL